MTRESLLAKLKADGRFQAGDAPERRMVSAGSVEVRAGEDGKTLVGLAAPFGKRSVDLGWFVEEIKPGAFRDAIGRSDAAALFNHNPDNLLGRQSAGTLTLEEADEGLRYTVRVPDSEMARSVLQSVERGDLRGNSFAFTVEEDVWGAIDGDTLLRTVVKVRELFDVGPVVYPAYRDTTVSVRSFAILPLRADIIALRERELAHLMLDAGA